MDFFSDLLNALPGALAQGLIWGLMAIGVYITFKVLDLADLTVDGTMCTGGAVCIMLMTNGVNVWVALLCAFIAGMIAGAITGLLHTAMGIPAILAGILTQLALFSINLRIMGGKANQAINPDNYDLLVSLRNVKHLSLENPILVTLLFTAVLIALLYWFFGTELGSGIRATGANPNMSRAQGINVNRNKVLGLMISNGIVALSSALYSQYQGFADVNAGRGAIVIGLAAVIIGDVIFSRIFQNFALKLVSVSLGAVIYYVVIQIVLTLGLDSNDLKLFSALVVAIFLAVPIGKTGISAANPRQSPQGKRRVSPMLELNGLYKVFNAGTVNEKRAIDGLDLTLEEGDFVTVIGGNGAGKSTTLNLIAGVFPADRGTIRLNGVDITRLPEHKRAKYLGRVFQDPMMGTAATMGIEENLALANRRGKSRGLRPGITSQERDLFRAQLAALGLGLENRLTSKVGLLSGGQRQALTLLMATLNQPKLLLLDEHTAALDPKTADKVLQLTEEIVARDHLTTLMVTHNMKHAIQYGNRLIMMDAGRVVVDIRGEEKKNLTVSDLLEKFNIENDRMLLSE